MSAPFDLTVTSDFWEPADVWRAQLARAFDACAVEAGARWPGRTISVLLCDDGAIRTLNRDWRGLDKATNVLSFPAAVLRGAPHDVPLGDIAVAFETAQREARAEGKTLPAHVLHLAVHGALHLLGQDHETDEDAAQMEAAERRILARLGIADPYGDAAGSDARMGTGAES